MAVAGLQKYFDDVSGLQKNLFFKQTGLKEDLTGGKVFPAIRKNEVHFYYGGARLCVYKNGHMYTNNRYLDIADNRKSRDVRITEEWFTPARYEVIKGNCKEWRDPKSELSVVGQLFPNFSIARSDLPADRARLLDIECRFPGAELADEEPPKAQHMIDCLFLTPAGTLVFIEVKRNDNREARSSGQREPAVAGQLRRYRLQLGSEGLRSEIRDVYADVTDTLGQIVEARLPAAPQVVFEHVPLLIVGPDSAPSPGAKEVWQRDLLASPLSFDSEIIRIDGRDKRMSDALDEFFRTLDSARGLRANDGLAPSSSLQ